MTISEIEGIIKDIKTAALVDEDIEAASGLERRLYMRVLDEIANEPMSLKTAKKLALAALESDLIEFTRWNS